jgi:hypothetical protein
VVRDPEPFLEPKAAHSQAAASPTSR